MNGPDTAPQPARTVVIFEPDDLHGPLVQRLFLELGWRAVWADRPSRALRALYEDQVPDLLLIAGQPTQDVSVMAQMIVEPLPVLYMSASVFRSRPPRHDEPGVLAKPFTLEELAALVELALDPAAVPAA